MAAVCESFRSRAIASSWLHRVKGLHGFRKIPFACSYLPGKSQVHMVFLGAAALMWLVVLSAHYELQVLQEPRGMMAMLALFTAAAICIRWTMAAIGSFGEEELRFEEAPDPAIFELGLHRDGVVPL